MCNCSTGPRPVPLAILDSPGEWLLDLPRYDPGVRPDDVAAISLKRIAEKAIEHRFKGKILVGHCCSLARQDDDLAKRTIDLVAEASLSVVSLPMCNMYLQDRVAGLAAGHGPVLVLGAPGTGKTTALLAAVLLRDHITPLRAAGLALIVALALLAWLARRWSDPAFPRHFPWFNSERYWGEHILELREQLAAMNEPPLVIY